MSTGDTSMGNPILAPVSVISPRWVIIQVGKMKVNRDKFYWLQQDTAGYLRLKDLLISSQLVWKGTKRVGCTMVEKFPYKGKKGRYKKGNWIFLRLPADSWRLSLKKENGCSLSLQSSWQHIWKVQSERSCSKRWVLSWMDARPISLRAGENGRFFCLSVFLSFCISVFLSFYVSVFLWLWMYVRSISLRAGANGKLG